MKYKAVIMLFLLSAVPAAAQYPHVTIRQIQEVPPDSLRILDSLGCVRWTLQTSPRNRDTVTVTGVCVVPAKVLNLTVFGYNWLLADTGSPNIWGGLFVRPNISSTLNPQDTLIAILWGMLNVQPGDLIRFVGRVEEFPENDCASTTMIVPIFSIPLQIIGSAPIPPPVPTTISQFYSGPFPGGRTRFSTGEPLEGMRVSIRNVLVHSALNVTNCTFNMVDSSGNMMSTHDASKWYTCRGHRDPNSTFVPPPIGTRIDSIRGFILSVSGAEAPRGYRIAPIYNDIIPEIPRHYFGRARRIPIVVSSDSSTLVTVRAYRIAGGFGIYSVKLFYSVNSGPFVETSMTYTIADSTARGLIPAQPSNSFVKYFLKAFDTFGNSTTLASYSSHAAPDTFYGTFFYHVINRPLTIRDVQYTPFLNGYSPYAMEYPFGATVTISGIVTADTSDWINPSPSLFNSRGWYLQSSTLPWSGIWIDGPESTMSVLRRGDSVSVTGTVQEWMSFQQAVTTRLANVQHPVLVHSTGNAEPLAVQKPTGHFATNVTNGDPNAEPFEGMLVRFTNATVTNTWPYFADPTVYEVNDGSGPVWIVRSGRNSYVPQLGDRIGWIRGIVHYAVNTFRLLPRKDDDIGPITSVLDNGNEVPRAFELHQSYPNPFNPATVIRYRLPVGQDGILSYYVTLKVYDVLGREVATLVDESKVAGYYEVILDGSQLSSGVYLYRMVAGNYSSARKFVVMR